MQPGTGPVDCAPKFARGRRIRKCIRTGALLTVIGLMRAARIVRTRWEAHKQRCELERELAAYQPRPSGAILKRLLTSTQTS